MSWAESAITAPAASSTRSPFSPVHVTRTPDDNSSTRLTRAPRTTSTWLASASGREPTPLGVLKNVPLQKFLKDQRRATLETSSGRQKYQASQAGSTTYSKTSSPP